MKPQRGSSIAGPSLGGLWGRSATGDNGQAAKERSCRYGDGAECRKNISGVPTGEVFFHLTSFIGPFLMYSQTVRQQPQLAFKQPRPTIGFLGRKPVPIAVKWTGTSVPEFSNVL